MSSSYDVVIVGGGHNGLVSAAYLSKKGLSVLILERRSVSGGATLSAEVFPGIAAKPSVYSYLVSLFPKKIMTDLGLTFSAKRRRTASFTPYMKDGAQKGLLISNEDEEVTKRSFRELTGSDEEYEKYLELLRLEKLVADRIWPTMLEPLESKEKMHARFDTTDAQAAWKIFMEEPLGYGLERSLSNDLVRGLVFTDAKIGMFTEPYDMTLLQNRTFLYHIIGNGTGEWQVPVGGMGSLVAGLEEVARKHGTETMLSAEVKEIRPGDKPVVVFVDKEGKENTVECRFVLVNSAPSVLANILPGYEPPLATEGSVFKINMLLTKLPRLKDRSVSPEDAFSGTFHIGEGYEEMKTSFDVTSHGDLPQVLPGEMYCHTLTDDSVLSSELAGKGYHTLTFFGLDTPYELFKKDNEKMKAQVLEQYVREIDQYLEESLESCLATDANGKPCLEMKSPVDIEEELRMPRGNIFHGDLTWPFAEKIEDVGTWGVETGFENTFICGSGAKRGGAVSGIPGHNAAQKVMEIVDSSI
jgi:phytoene dehydrogenase-like protein